jgi:hypothetical protein
MKYAHRHLMFVVFQKMEEVTRNALLSLGSAVYKTPWIFEGQKAILAVSCNICKQCHCHIIIYHDGHVSVGNVFDHGIINTQAEIDRIVTNARAWLSKHSLSHRK